MIFKINLPKCKDNENNNYINKITGEMYISSFNAVINLMEYSIIMKSNLSLTGICNDEIIELILAEIISNHVPKFRIFKFNYFSCFITSDTSFK